MAGWVVLCRPDGKVKVTWQAGNEREQRRSRTILPGQIGEAPMESFGCSQLFPMLQVWIGVALGWVATEALGPLEFADQARLVPHVERELLVPAFVVLVVTAVLAGLPAANHAARLDPAEALREE